MNYDCVCFDFDGTLINSNLIKSNFFKDLKSKCLSEDGVLVKKPLSVKNRFEFLKSVTSSYQKYGLKCPINEDFLTNSLDGAVLAASLFPGAYDLLNFLKSKSVDCHLLSATPTSSLIKIAKSKGIIDFFLSVTGWPNQKTRSLSKLKSCYNGSLVMIGDGVDDRQAADNANVSFISVGEGRGALGSERIYKIDELLHMWRNV